MSDALGRHTLKELEEEISEGLRIQVETSWGWSDVKVRPFLKQVEKGRGDVVIAYCDISRRTGALTLKIPLMVPQNRLGEGRRARGQHLPGSDNPAAAWGPCGCLSPRPKAGGETKLDC
jgi:hypothetical protein